MEDTYPSPEKYVETLIDTNVKGDAMILEFQRLYVLSKMNPSNQEIQQSYQTIVYGLEDVKTQLTTMTTDIQENIQQINRTLLSLNIQIQKERSINEELKRQLRSIQNETNTSFELIDNYKEIYSAKYLDNWSMFFSTVLVCYWLHKLAAPKLAAPVQ